MRIAFLTGQAVVGGAQILTVDLAIQLRELGHDVMVLFIARGGALTERLDAADVPWTAPPDRSGDSSPLRGAISRLVKAGHLGRELNRFRPDIVQAAGHATVAFCFPIARVACREAVLIAALHGNNAAETVGVGGRRAEYLFTSLDHRIQKEIPRAAAVVIVSESLRQLAHTAGATDSQIEVIANGVHTPATLSDTRRQPPTCVMVARFTHVKGYDVLIDALAMVNAPINVRLCGDGPERSTIAASIEAEGLQDTVELVPIPANIPAELMAAQFAVQPSRFEAMSIAAVEARATGLPVIASHVGGLPGVVTDGITGLLVPPEDPASLAAAIERLATNPDLRERLGRQAREIPAEFTIERCAALHVDLYNRLLTKKSLVRSKNR